MITFKGRFKNRRKLNVYQLSKTLVKDIYGMTAEFPVNEKYALSDQMRRASLKSRLQSNHL